MADEASKMNWKETIIIVCNLVTPVTDVPFGFYLELLNLNIIARLSRFILILLDIELDIRFPIFLYHVL
jgi:hypothetical protein